MTTHTFSSPEPVDLRVEIRRGRIEVAARDTDATTVVVDGPGSDAVRVEQVGDVVRVVAPPRTGLLPREPDLDVRVVVPEGSRAAVRTGSADIEGRGSLGEVELETGSGDVRVDTVTGEAHLKTGSGDVGIDVVGGDATLKTGSGDVRLGAVEGSLVATTGSGDVTLESYGPSATVRTGSGDVRIESSAGDLAVSTGSGSIVILLAPRGSIRAKAGSGDLSLGVPAGTPVWTDVSTSSGQVRSQLDGVGAPAEGQDHLELRVRTASGDIHIEQR